MDRIQEQAREQDRRRYFRIEDRVGLQLEAIRPEDEASLIASIDDPSARAGLFNELRAVRDKHLPERRSLEYKFPTVAAYVKVLEKQIEILALAIGDGEGFSVTPDTLVNLSAQGMSLDQGEIFALDSLVEARLTLFPDRCHIRAIARVIRSDQESAVRRTALDFVHLRDADREAIIRHVHMLQRLQLQAIAEEALDAAYPDPRPGKGAATKPRLRDD
nr:PilZ domain-containing protein [Thiocystis violacea]